MRFQTFIAVGILFLMSGVAVAQKPDSAFEFRTLRLGMTQAEAKTAVPALICENRTAEIVQCVADTGAGAQAENYQLTFLKDRLASANMWFAKERYREFRDLALRSFGRPNTKPTGEMTKKEVEIYAWVRKAPNGMAVLEQTASTDATKSTIYFNDDAMSAEVAKLMK